MKDNKLKAAINKAEELGSYFITVTTRDTGLAENDLTHFYFKKEFSTDDIIPSVDHCVRLASPRLPDVVEVFTPPEPSLEEKPLRIAIMSHFNRCPDSYSPGKAVKNQIKLLKRYGHQVTFFVVEGSKLEMDCEIRRVVPAFKRIKGVVNEEAKSKFIEVLKQELPGKFDLVITHDFYIDDCITYREAIKECGVDIQWLHWARSGVGAPINFAMPKARYVYMNKTDAGHFASRIGVYPDKIRVVYNEKDPSFFLSWNPITSFISDRMRLWDKDIIQAYPMCTTRMDAKGIDSVIRTFAALKRAGKKVALIICNSNGRRRVDEIKHKIDYASSLGLNEGDFLFTSTISTPEMLTESEVPNQVVAQLMGVSNLFVFPTQAEVCSNVELEASMSRNLLVLNKDLPSLFDFADRDNVLSYPFTSSRSIHFDGRDDKSMDDLAAEIINKINDNAADKQMRHVWRNHCVETVYQKQLRPILYERI